MILGSIITTIISPFANIFGHVLAVFYSFTHSFGLSIILLTLATMVIVFPLTRAGTRSMMRMQLLQPELKKIQTKYKAKPGMSAEERQANRVKLNEEMMALYRENGVNPTGGCLPMFMQFPIFIVLYDTIRGMTRTITVHGKSVLSPQYIPKNSPLYRAVLHSHGNLKFIGINLADSVRSHLSVPQKIPYVAVILIAVALQYVSIWQITNRNPSAANANPQMQAVQKFMPLIFIFIYILLPAGVGIYFIVSSLFRVGQQEYMYKHDPKIVASVKEIHKRRALDATAKPSKGGGDKPSLGRPSGAGRRAAGSANPGPRKSLRERMRDAAAGFQGTLPDSAATDGESTSKPATEPKAAPAKAQPSSGARTKTGGNGSTSSSNGASTSGANGSEPKSAAQTQNRSKAKRPRRP